MEYIVIILICIVFLILLVSILGLSIKKLKQIAENKELDELTNSFPENMEICKSILKKLNNTKVKIKEETESQTSLYVVVNDTITIANIRNSFTRIQTIAHECLHSIQSKKILWFNFIYTNIYMLYFLTITILTLTKAIKEPLVFLCILIITGIIQYFIRNILETEAMTKARYVAEDYLEENKICLKENIQKIVHEYDKLNDIGIKFVNYKLLLNNIVKIIIYAVVCIVANSL